MIKPVNRNVEGSFYKIKTEMSNFSLHQQLLENW